MHNDGVGHVWQFVNEGVSGLADVKIYTVIRPPPCVLNRSPAKSSLIVTLLSKLNRKLDCAGTYSQELLRSRPFFTYFPAGTNRCAR